MLVSFQGQADGQHGQSSGTVPEVHIHTQTHTQAPTHAHFEGSIVVYLLF